MQNNGTNVSVVSHLAFDGVEVTALRPSLPVHLQAGEKLVATFNASAPKARGSPFSVEVRRDVT